MKYDDDSYDNGGNADVDVGDGGVNGDNNDDGVVDLVLLFGYLIGVGCWYQAKRTYVRAGFVVR